MSTVDVIILAVVALGVVWGLLTGLLRQVASLAGFVLAFVLAIELMPVLAETLFAVDALGEGGRRVLSFLVVFGTVEILFFVIGRLAHAAAGALKLSAPNRLAGGLFGGLQGVLAAGVMLLLLGRVGFPDPTTRENSLLYAHVVGVMPSAWDVVADVWPQVKTISSRFGEDVRAYWTRKD